MEAFSLYSRSHTLYMEPVREKTEHLLSLKVMRLTRPTLIGPNVVTSDIRDLPNDTLNGLLKNDVTSVLGCDTISSGEFLLLPQCFGNIYLGETFSSYICVHNGSNQIAKDVTVKATLQTQTKNIMLSTNPPTSTDLVAGSTVDEVIQHEVNEFGAHILVCEVSYCSGTLSSDLLRFQKIFKFEVLKPLDVKTKLYTAELDEVYVEAQVQNITSGPLNLEKVSVEPSNTFNVIKLNTAEANSEFDLTLVANGGRQQFIYCLNPLPNVVADVKTTNGMTYIGKLDIIWRSNLGERGHLQTSPLLINALNTDLRLSVIDTPDIVVLEEPFEFSSRIVNTSERSMELILILDDNESFAWCALSGEDLGVVPPRGSITFTLRLVPLLPGLQFVSGIRIRDPFLKRTHEYDKLVQVFVMHGSSSQKVGANKNGVLKMCSESSV